MDDLGPRIRQLTKLSQQDKKSFELEWVLPLEPSLRTHVMLYDVERFPPEVLGGGHGADQGESLQELWTAFSGRNDAADAPVVTDSAQLPRSRQHPRASTVGSSTRNPYKNGVRLWA